MKSNSSETELGIGILLVATMISAELKGISIKPLFIWGLIIFVGMPLLDKLVLASTFHSPITRWLVKAFIVCLTTGLCLLL